MEIYENGTIREATQEEIERAARDKEAAEKIIVQMSLTEVIQLLSPRLFEDVEDKIALHMVDFFQTWESKIGKLVSKDERLSYKEKLYKVLQPHTVQSDWTPDTAVSLYVEVSIEEWPEIPEYITAESAWMKGQKGTWKGEHYICNMDNCVWNPEQLPSAWDKQ